MKAIVHMQALFPMDSSVPDTAPESTAAAPASTDDAGRPEQGRARLRQIDVTARNGDEAWVKEGLASGTQVIVYPDRKLKDGDRVSGRKPR